MSTAAQNDPLYRLSTLIETETWQKPFLEMREIVQAGMQEIAALRRFKAYVHERLDDAGIPTHPDGEHSKAGCRVGDRLDIALDQWPEWAEKLLRLLESWGAEYDADDEINLPDELAEWLHHYASDIKRSAERARSKQAAADE